MWITGLALLGRAVGSNWQSWRHHLEYVDYAALALSWSAIVYLIVVRRFAGAARPHAAPDADAGYARR